MKEVIEYLKDPMKKGVYNGLYKLNINCFRDIYKKIAEDEDHPNYEGAKATIEDESLLFDDDWFFINLSECIAGILYNNPIEEFYDLLNIDQQSIKEEVLKSMKDDKEPLEDALHEELWERAQEILDTRVIEKTIDAIHIDDISERKKNNKLDKFFEITTIKEETLELFETFMNKIPHINENFDVVKKRNSFSSRNIYRPYPCAVELWLKDESTIHVPKDLLDLIEASSKYHQDEEWRTSVILSAIVIESILADIYEEEKKENAPDVPLGALFERVKNFASIPNEIQEVIGLVNQARISAVHRSKSPVSDRDADIALYGTTKTTMWFIENY